MPQRGPPATRTTRPSSTWAGGSSAASRPGSPDSTFLRPPHDPHARLPCLRPPSASAGAAAARARVRQPVPCVRPARAVPRAPRRRLSPETARRRRARRALDAWQPGHPPERGRAGTHLRPRQGARLVPEGAARADRHRRATPRHRVPGHAGADRPHGPRRPGARRCRPEPGAHPGTVRARQLLGDAVAVREALEDRRAVGRRGAARAAPDRHRARPLRVGQRLAAPGIGPTAAQRGRIARTALSLRPRRRHAAEDPCRHPRPPLWIRQRMKLISYLHGGASHWGCVIGDGVVDLGRRLPACACVAALLEGGDAALAQARPGAEGAAPDHALADVRLKTPIARPRRVFCVGVNYAHRNAEYKDGSDLPKYPSIFMRVAESFVGHGEPLQQPLESTQLDYEGEIAIVIGQRARRVQADDALACIAGITCMNEGTVRDWTHHAKFNVTQGKNWNASGAIGPWIVTAEEFPQGNIA